MDILQNTNTAIVLDEVIADGRFAYGEKEWEDLPPVRRLALESRPEQGSFIRFELWLPESWNGIFLGCGNGGMAGGISYGQLTRFSKKGYAVAHTDLGTSRGVESGVHNPVLWRDFGWRATHLMTVVSRALIRAHYGRDADYCYFNGASTGGQQAMSLAQRFPTDYDGIIAGVPASNRVFLHAYFLWNYVHLRTEEGRVLFAPEKVEHLSDLAAAFFQARGDGERGDNFVTDPHPDAGTVADFLRYIKDNATFTDEQRAALRAVYEGPVNPRTGEQIYNGAPIGSEVCGLFREAEREGGMRFYPFRWAFGMDFAPHSFDFDKDLTRIAEKMAPDLNANSPDLTAFAARGGKLIAFSGSADPVVPYPDFLKYYHRVCACMGGMARVQEFFKYYLLPGKDHNSKGRGIGRWWLDDESRDVLCALRRWREEGIAPQEMTGVHVEEDTVTLQRQIAAYTGGKREGEQFPKSCNERYLRM